MVRGSTVQGGRARPRRDAQPTGTATSTSASLELGILSPRESQSGDGAAAGRDQSAPRVEAFRPWDGPNPYGVGHGGDSRP